MNVRKILFYVLAGLLGGCVPVVSLHPFYTKENVVFDKKLLGTWVDDPIEPEFVWKFESIEDPNGAYGLHITGKDGLKGAFVVHMIKLRGKLFLDVYPGAPWNIEDPNLSGLPFNSLLQIPTHTLVRIDSFNPKLKMSLMSEARLKKMLEANPDAIAHVEIEDRPVLTASTKELQAFVLKHLDDEELFTDKIILERRD